MCRLGIERTVLALPLQRRLQIAYLLRLKHFNFDSAVAQQIELDLRPGKTMLRLVHVQPAFGGNQMPGAGLLDDLVPIFEERRGINVKVIRNPADGFWDTVSEVSAFGTN